MRGGHTNATERDEMNQQQAEALREFGHSDGSRQTGSDSVV